MSSNNNGKSHIPLTKEEFEKHKPLIDGKLQKTEWSPKKDSLETMQGVEKSTSSTTAWTAHRGASGQKDVTEIVKSVMRICDEKQFLDPDGATVMTTIRTGFMLGMRVFELFTQSSGLDRLIAQNQKSRLQGEQGATFHELHQTGAYLVLFSAASYIRWSLSSYKAEEVSALQLQFRGVPEVDLSNLYSAMDCSLYYYGSYLAKTQVAQNEVELIKFTLLYFEGLLDELSKQLASVKHTEFYTNVSYKLENTDFILDGFNAVSSVVVVENEYNKVEFENIVGNTEAKHAARRRAMVAACYDPTLKMNPWNELGGFIAIALGSGVPGTGKSLQIAAMATLIDEYCNRRGIGFELDSRQIVNKDGVPHFAFHPMPNTLISTYQGGSAEHMVNWMQRLHDSDKVIYAPIDDGENNLEDRGRKGVSSGVREVIGVFLRYTEGASAINNGNWMIDIMTNLPEQVDKAVLSRIQSRFPINGARTVNDFADQDHLWWRDLQKIDPSFVDVLPIPEYDWLSDQRNLTSLKEVDTGDIPITNRTLRKIVEKVKGEHQVEEAEFFGKLYWEMQQAFPRFSSRDVRNIQKSVMNRAMDFDCPDEWFDDPRLFFDRPIDERVEILRGLMRENVNGMSLSHLRYIEAIKYMNQAAEIESVETNQAIEELLNRARVRAQAQEIATEQGIDPRLVY